MYIVIRSMTRESPIFIIRRKSSIGVGRGMIIASTIK